MTVGNWMSPDALDRRQVLRSILSAVVGVSFPSAARASIDQLTAGLGSTPELTEDTINGLVAFIVPGPDPYSIAQGVVDSLPGGIEAGATSAFIAGINLDFYFLPTLADTIAELLNGVALTVNPESASGDFLSPFANLSFLEKAVVFSVLEGDASFEPFRNLISVLPGLVVFIAFSEAGVFDPSTRSLVAEPVGWSLTAFDGVAEGRDEFMGYYHRRRRAHD